MFEFDVVCDGFYDLGFGVVGVDFGVMVEDEINGCKCLIFF